MNDSICKIKGCTALRTAKGIVNGRTRYRTVCERHRARYSRPLTDEQRQKKRARKKVGKAIKSGKLVRKPCEVCKSTPVDGHHNDYDQALVVVWLCKTHHLALHNT